MTRTHVLFLLAAASFTSSALFAQDALPEVDDTIIVTATRSERSQFDVVPSTIVIEREAIENAQASDLAELLRFQAGLDIGRNGGPGQTTSVFIRGTESNHTLVLIDGVEMNPGTIGGAAIQNINPEIIERIEIVKGARSALYGSEAIGGVINIITRNAKRDSIETRFGLGSFGTRTIGFSGSTQQDDRYANLSVNWEDTDGFPTAVSASDDRGYDNLSLNFTGGLNLFDTDFELAFWQADGNTEYFDFFGSPLDQDYTNQSTALKVKRDLSTNWSSQLILANAKDEIEQKQLNFLGSNDFVKTDRLSVDWFNTYKFSGKTSFVGGAYYAREKTDALSFGTGFADPTEIKSVFLGSETKFGGFDALANVRFTDHDTAGNQVSWNLEGQYPVTTIFDLGFSAGQAFRAPDATDRFGFGGNPELNTEESLNLALVLAANTNFGRFRLEAFQNDIDDLINFVVTDPATFAGQNENVEEAEIRGVELTHQYTWNKLELISTALVQSPKNKTTDSVLLRRARRSLSNEARYNFSGGHNIGLQSLFTSQRADFAGSLPGYALLNLTGKYQLNDRISLFAKIENLSDKEYQTAAGFNQAERAYYLNVRLKY